MVSESQLVDVIKQAKESDKDRKFKQSVEMIMVFRDVDVCVKVFRNFKG